MRNTERPLRTVLFTDIIGSTERAAELGDHGWGELLAEFYVVVRREVRRFGGREANTAGDSFLVVFDRPARAIRCAWAIREAVRELGLEVRSGVHTGEVEEAGANLGGIAVHIGARVMSEADSGEVLVSGTVRDLVTGAGFRFEDRGPHALKGVPGEWRLFALESLPAGPMRIRTTTRLPELTARQLQLAVALILILLAGLLVLYLASDNAGRLSPREAVAGRAAPGIAVVPFQITGPRLEEWREGMVDLLSTNLDGTAGLRTIDSRTVLARWSEALTGGSPGDLETALEVGRRAGARYVLVGSAVAIGEGVRLRAEVYDAVSGAKLGQGQVEGVPDSVFQLVDRLSIEVLRAIPQVSESELSGIDLARITTSSVPALRAYLKGEALYRRSDFAAAIPAYVRAVEEDSTFALAYARLANAYGWAETISSDIASDAGERAVHLADRLPEREAILVRAERELFHGTLDGLDPLREAVRRYPDDPEAWYLLGDTYFHLGNAALVDRSHADGAFARAIDLDPRFAPAYLHRIEWAFQQADSARARGLIDAHRRIAAGSRYQSRYELAFALAFGNAGARARALEALDTLPTEINGIALLNLAHVRFLDVQAQVLDVGRRLRDPELAGRSSLYYFFNHLQRGKWQDARAALEDASYPAGLRGLGLHLARARGFPVPVELLERELSSSGVDTLPIPIFFAGAYAAEAGRWQAFTEDRERLRELARRLEQQGDSTGARFVTGMERALEGLEAWKRGRRGEALEILQAAQREAAGHNVREAVNGTIRWWIGELLIEMGRPREAVRYFTLWLGEPLLAYRRAQIYEQLGELARAREEYETFALAWRDADPELATLAARARQAAVRLRDLERG